MNNPAFKDDENIPLMHDHDNIPYNLQGRWVKEVFQHLLCRKRC